MALSWGSKYLIFWSPKREKNGGEEKEKRRREGEEEEEKEKKKKKKRKRKRSQDQAKVWKLNLSMDLWNFKGFVWLIACL